MPQVRDTEGFQLVVSYRNQVEVALPAGKAVPEFASRRQSGRSRGEDFEPRKCVCADLQQAARIGQLVDLIQDQSGSGDRAIERLGIGKELLDGGKVAIQVLAIDQTGRQCGLPGSTHSGKPNNRGFLPTLLNPLEPEWAQNH
jgi:hypothetical protein